MLKNVLLVTDGIFHPPYWGRVILHRTLRQMTGFAFQHTRSLENLPADLDRFSALVLHYHHNRITPAALKKLDTYVENGGGVLAIHAATASFKETQPYFDILGGRFIEHGQVEEFEVSRVKDDLFAGIDNFVVRDELYIHELRPGIVAHFTARYAGEDIPVVWTYPYGAGRVCYACPGHLMATMKNPAYQKVLQLGLAWVCAEQAQKAIGEPRG